MSLLELKLKPENGLGLWYFQFSTAFLFSLSPHKLGDENWNLFSTNRQLEKFPLFWISVALSEKVGRVPNLRAHRQNPELFLRSFADAGAALTCRRRWSPLWWRGCSRWSDRSRTSMTCRPACPERLPPSVPWLEIGWVRVWSERRTAWHRRSAPSL